MDSYPSPSNYVDNPSQSFMVDINFQPAERFTLPSAPIAPISTHCFFYGALSLNSTLLGSPSYVDIVYPLCERMACSGCCSFFNSSIIYIFFDTDILLGFWRFVEVPLSCL